MCSNGCVDRNRVATGRNQDDGSRRLAMFWNIASTTDGG